MEGRRCPFLFLPAAGMEGRRCPFLFLPAVSPP